MPIDFPTSPTTGQVYTYGGRSWVYNGTGWDAPQALSEIGAVRTYANAAARTAAIPSPSEGIVTYLNDVDRLDTHNGSAWVPAAGLNLITSQTFTSTNAVNVDNVFTSLYRNYQIFISLTSVSVDGMQVQYQHRQGNSTVETNYRSQRIYNFGSTIVSDDISGITNYTSIFAGINTGNIGGAFASFIVANPFLSQPTTTLMTSTSGFGASGQIDQRTSTVQTQSISVTGFRILCNGTNQAAGTFSVYGVK